MSGRSFVDTNVLAYAVDFSVAERAKRQIAQELLRADPSDLVISAQILQEYYVVVTRKLKQPMSQAQAAATVHALAKLPMVTADVDLVLAGIATSQEHQLSIWDAMVIEAARQAGCRRVLTEDLSHGQTIRGVRIENPFLDC